MSGDSMQNDMSNEYDNENDSNMVEEVEEDDDIRKLFVGGLSWETTEQDVKEYFQKWGDIKSVVIKIDKFTGQSRGFGFVLCGDEETVSKILEMKEHRLKNKKIDPKRAKPNREPLKKIFVGGLDPDVTEEQIKEYFGKYGKIESLDLPFDNQKGKRKSYIFVTFSTELEAKKATQGEKQDIYGRQCDVRIAVPREQANRQKGYQSSYNRYPDYSCNPYGMDYVYGGYGYDPYGYAAGYGAYDYGASTYSASVPNRGGGKMRGAGGNGAGGGAGRGYPTPAAAAPGSYHPYNRM